MLIQENHLKSQFILRKRIRNHNLFLRTSQIIECSEIKKFKFSVKKWPVIILLGVFSEVYCGMVLKASTANKSNGIREPTTQS